jgi:chemotaxis response regulator CheB
MPVELITERLDIEPNHVFVIPEKRDLHVLDGEFRLKPNPSFLSTLRDSLVNIYGREKAKITYFFGAGIAGLSAAHELKQRGYRILDVYFDKSPLNG